jgi:hypothetical protein
MALFAYIISLFLPFNIFSVLFLTGDWWVICKVQGHLFPAPLKNLWLKLRMLHVAVFFYAFTWLPRK